MAKIYLSPPYPITMYLGVLPKKENLYLSGPQMKWASQRRGKNASAM